MKNVFRSGLFLLAILAGGCHINWENALPFKSFDSAIIPQRDKYYIPADASAFRPSKTELKLVESVLKSVYQEEMVPQDYKPPIPLRKYNRQYFGYLNERGERIIFVQCFYQERSDWQGWRTFIHWVDDGCNGYFRVKVNLTTAKYFDFQVNPCA